MSVSSLAPWIIVSVTVMVSFPCAVVIVPSVAPAAAVPIPLTVSFAIVIASLVCPIRSVSRRERFSVAPRDAATLISTAVKSGRAAATKNGS